MVINIAYKDKWLKKIKLMCKYVQIWRGGGILTENTKLNIIYHNHLKFYHT